MVGDDEQELLRSVADEGEDVVGALVRCGAEDAIEDIGPSLGRQPGHRLAVRILVAQRGLTKPAAFDLLRPTSQQTDRKLRDIATDLVDTATLPDPLTRPA